MMLCNDKQAVRATATFATLKPAQIGLIAGVRPTNMHAWFQCLVHWQPPKPSLSLSLSLQQSLVSSFHLPKHIATVSAFFFFFLSLFSTCIHRCWLEKLAGHGDPGCTCCSSCGHTFHSFRPSCQSHSGIWLPNPFGLLFIYCIYV